MRKNYFKKMISVLSLSCFVLTANAAEFYVSPTGNDNNDGKTLATAKKTLCGIDAVVTMSDTVNVRGIIDVTVEPKRGVWGSSKGGELLVKNDSLAGFFLKANWGDGDVIHNNWAYVTFLGENPEEDGFDAKLMSRCFSLDGGTFYFRNLGFFNGRDVVEDGGCGVWSRSSNPYFVNCLFKGHTVRVNPNDQNKVVGGKGGSNERGGAFYLMNSNATFHGCTFTENQQKSGSGILQAGGNLVVEGCTFIDNNADVCWSNGGAIMFWNLNDDLTATVNNSLFKNNSVTETGGAIAFRQSSDQPNRDSQTNIGGDIDIKITKCSFIGNRSTDGAAVSYKMEKNAVGNNFGVNFLIAGCNFYGNNTTGYGGAVQITGPAREGYTFDIVNSTFYGNYTAGNTGHGPGVMTRNEKDDDPLMAAIHLKKRIYNCILYGNYATKTSEGMENYREFSDISRLNYDVSVGEDALLAEFDIKNCIIGGTINVSFENYPDNEMFYYTTDETTGLYIDDNKIGFDLASDCATNFGVMPLNATSLACNFGNVEYLTQYGITTDQMDVTFSTTDGKCPIGATAIDLDLLWNETNPYVFPREISDEVAATIPEVPLGVKYTEIKNGGVFNFAGNGVNLNDAAELSVINMAGVTVKTGKDKVSLYDLPRGVYIVKGKLNGSNRVFVQKFVK